MTPFPPPDFPHPERFSYAEAVHLSPFPVVVQFYVAAAEPVPILSGRRHRAR